MKPRVAAGVALLWTLVGILWGAQSSLAAALQGQPQALGPAVVDALHQSLPWIPATLGAIALALRAPLTRRTWRRNLWPHLVAIPLAAFSVNVLVVLGYWARQGSYKSLGTLAGLGVVWGLSRLHVTALAYAATVGVTQAVEYWRALRLRELALAQRETQLERTRLQVLNAQIRPHFLFNTLHTIGQLWRSGRDDDADALLDHLGALFQRVIASTSRTQVPLSEELAMVRDYLAIEQARFGARMTSRIDADDGALSCLVPPLILQPLVENAVKHGVAASVAAGQVVVTARVEGDRLVLVVRDDGPSPGGNGATAGTGTGLQNVRERLFGLYGERQSLERTARAGAGTDVRLSIPAVGEPAGA